MATVQITKHYSGFANVCDTYCLGNHEHAGMTEMTAYRLPDGYTYAPDMDAIYDPDGWMCAIVDGADGYPVLISRGGTRPDARIEEF